MPALLRLAAVPLLAGLALGALPATAAAPAPAVGHILTLSEDWSSPKKSDALVTEAVRLINNTKAPAEVMHFGYLFDRPELADAMIAARKRGVVVQLILDRVAKGPQSEKVAAKLGRTRGAGSFVYYVKRSGFTAKAGHYLHGKGTVINQSGGERCVTITSSQNYAWTNTRSSAGASDVYHDCTLYTAVRAFAKDLAADRERPDYVRKVSANGITMWMGPGQPQAVYSSLRGLKGRPGARVDVGMWQWSNAASQVRIARELRSLAGQGVAVSVAINYLPHRDVYGRKVAAELLRKTASGKPSPVQIYNVRRPGPRVAIYDHRKAVMINDGRGHTEVWSGSKNFNGNDNADVLTRDTSLATWKAYVAHQARLVDIGSPFRQMPVYGPEAATQDDGQEWDGE